MPRRIILHPGFHKTGTSTIQAFLRHNRPILNAHVALRLRPNMGDLIHATRGYSTWRDPLTLVKAGYRFGALLNALPAMPRRTLIISAEELGGHLPGRGELADYSAMPILLEVFHTLAAEHFPEAKIEIYLSTRAPDPWLASAYWEHVKASSMTMDFHAFAAKYKTAANLADTVEQIKTRLPCPVHDTPLESCKDLAFGPAQPLVDLLDLPDDVQTRLTPVPPSNARHSKAVLAALLDINRNQADPEARKKAKKAILTESKSQ